MIKGIQQAVSIPVMAKVRIGHIAEAQILQAIEIDYIDESERCSPRPTINTISTKRGSTCRSSAARRDLGEALRRIAEGASMIRTKGGANRRRGANRPPYADDDQRDAPPSVNAGG